ncbi:hypothetical protein Rhe02_12370 [Rhizocola hellebori]|uniref:Uncharacterized protein n=1 Tax=Rhizocola hellebori TaxID=1392758 RepID=A0A8J3Q4N4_9ACTN|nr:hypothetical protein Rhe02_12370 [Rhizocola hellebori]
MWTLDEGQMPLARPALDDHLLQLGQHLPPPGQRAIDDDDGIQLRVAPVQEVGPVHAGKLGGGGRLERSDVGGLAQERRQRVTAARPARRGDQIGIGARLHIRGPDRARNHMHQRIYRWPAAKPADRGDRPQRPGDSGRAAGRGVQKQGDPSVARPGPLVPAKEVDSRHAAHRPAVDPKRANGRIDRLDGVQHLAEGQLDVHAVDGVTHHDHGVTRPEVGAEGLA